jgi:hypothetical protein
VATVQYPVSKLIKAEATGRTCSPEKKSNFGVLAIIYMAIYS